MKITVKEKQEEKGKVTAFNDIPVGYVYIVTCKGGPVALKLRDNKAVLLTYGCEYNPDWFTLAVGFEGRPAHKILGKLTEIIVEEN